MSCHDIAGIWVAFFHRVPAISLRTGAGFTGNMCIDEQVLRKAGVTDFAQYDYITLGDTVEERLQNILAN